MPPLLLLIRRDTYLKRVDTRLTAGQSQMENGIPLLCLEVGTDRLRRVQGTHGDGGRLASECAAFHLSLLLCGEADAASTACLSHPVPASSVFPAPTLPQLSTQRVHVFSSQSRIQGPGDTPALPRKSTQALPAPRGWARSPGRTPFHSFGLSRAASSGGSTREENQLGTFQQPIQPETKEGIMRA